MNNIAVFKFGGSILENEGNILRAVEAVANRVSQGQRIVVVVSALKGVTDGLLNISKKISPEVTPAGLDEVLAMGERTSARLFHNALSSRGLESVVIDPDLPNWPIVTDDRFGDANPLYSETESRVKSLIEPLLEQRKIPVMGGFMGKTLDGRITTLGRGGSDTSAILIGSALSAKEVILVKDVDTVYSSDPDVVLDALPLQSLDTEEAMALASGGAKFLHAKALRYKKGTLLRIASLSKLEGAGTVIEGSAVDIDVALSIMNATMVTLVGLNTDQTGFYDAVLKGVESAKGHLVSVVISGKSGVIYVEGGHNLASHLHKSLVVKGLAKAISLYDNLVGILIRGSSLESIPGLIQKVTQPLARGGVNIYGVITLSSSFTLFVKQSEGEKAIPMVKTALMVS
jgi:aspartate kinase